MIILIPFFKFYLLLNLWRFVIEIVNTSFLTHTILISSHTVQFNFLIFVIRLNIID